MVKKFLRVLAGILICLVILLVVFSITGFGPHDRMPGLWLKGNVVTAPVSDWSFTENIPVIQIQTRTAYLLPHSVNINCLDYEGQLYLVSVYPAGTRHTWNENVMRDAHVRLKIGDQIYERTLSLVTEPAVQAGVLDARHKKYPELQIRPNSTMHVFHVNG